MVTEFHEIGPLLPPAEPGPDDQHPSEHLMLRVNTFLVQHRWAPDVVRVQLVITPLPGVGDALHQLFVTHPATTQAI